MKWTFLNANKESERERKKKKEKWKGALIARVRGELWLWNPFKYWLASKIGLEYNPNFQFFI
jgi:hypothetical protein